MRSFYSYLLYLLTPFLLIRLWFKSKKNKAYKERVRERFGSHHISIKSPCDIWIHAVSLGEVIAAIPLIEALLKNNHSILVTTTTPTGEAQVRKQFDGRVTHRFLPFDLPCAVKQFYKRYQPRMGVIMETELWPNLIYFAKKAKIPLLLVNARLSPRSFTQYYRWRFLFKSILNNFEGILAQNKLDAQRFVNLGADEKRVKVFGNIKFDQVTHEIDLTKFKVLKEQWGGTRCVLIAASTHEGEEQQLLNAFPLIQAAIPQVVLLIAPRHPERFHSVYQLAKKMKFNSGLRSDNSSISSHNEVIILDSLGELLGFYQMSDYAFVGGSLLPIGGHNVLEPIAVHKPVLTGPHIHNFKAICQELLDEQAIEMVDSAQQLMERIRFLHQNAAYRQQRVNQASRVLEANKGALVRYQRAIEALL